MKIKTSITLSEELLQEIDAHVAGFKNRSDFIEAALKSFIASIVRQEKNAKDLDIINRKAGRLNKEALDALEYQVSL